MKHITMNLWRRNGRLRKKIVSGCLVYQGFFSASGACFRASYEKLESEGDLKTGECIGCIEIVLCWSSNKSFSLKSESIPSRIPHRHTSCLIESFFWKTQSSFKRTVSIDGRYRIFCAFNTQSCVSFWSYNSLRQNSYLGYFSQEKSQYYFHSDPNTPKHFLFSRFDNFPLALTKCVNPLHVWWENFIRNSLFKKEILQSQFNGWKSLLFETNTVISPSSACIHCSFLSKHWEFVS